MSSPIPSLLKQNNEFKKFWFFKSILNWDFHTNVSTFFNDFPPLIVVWQLSPSCVWVWSLAFINRLALKLTITIPNFCVCSVGEFASIQLYQNCKQTNQNQKKKTKLFLFLSHLLIICQAMAGAKSLTKRWIVIHQILPC